MTIPKFIMHPILSKISTDKNLLKLFLLLRENTSINFKTLIYNRFVNTCFRTTLLFFWEITTCLLIFT